MSATATKVIIPSQFLSLRRFVRARKGCLDAVETGVGWMADRADERGVPHPEDADDLADHMALDGELAQAGGCRSLLRLPASPSPRCSPRDTFLPWSPGIRLSLPTADGAHRCGRSQTSSRWSGTPP